MKIAKTYSFYSVITIFFAILIMIFAWVIEKSEVEAKVNQEYDRVFERYKAILELKSNIIEKTTYDYSFWDDLVTFVENHDSQWSTINLLPLEQTFGISYIFVYDAEKKLIFNYSNSSSQVSIPIETIDPKLPVFKEFFLLDNEKPLQFFLAPIHFSSDTNRSGEPQGFLVFGREWNQAFFDSVEKLSLGKGQFLSLKDHNVYNKIAHEYHVPLLGMNEAPVGYVEITFESFLTNFASQMQNALIFASIFTGLFVFVLLSTLTEKLIFVPIKQLSLALKTKDINHINSLLETHNELGEMAHLMREYEEQKNLLESYKSAVDESMIVSRTDKRGFITYVNDEFVKISGFSKEELIGKSHNIVRHTDMPKEFFEEMWQTLKHGTPWKGVVKNKRKDGSSYYIKTVVVPVLDKDHRIKEYIGIRHDVTEIFDQVHRFSKETISGLPKAKELLDKIQHASEQKLHLAILNICAFHEINTLYGREIGDLYLQNFADRLKTMLNPQFSLFHLHADEFALYNESGIDNALFLEQCHSILLHLQTTFTINNSSHEIHLRIGIANGYENIYDRAENALKRARDMHKSLMIDDDVQGFEQRQKNNLQWNQKIRDAIVDHRFFVLFQQIVPLNSSSKQRKKYEALIRMKEEDGTILSPYFFLDIAKKLNLYDQLSRIVIEQATFMAKKHQCQVSINITKEDILTPLTVDTLFGCIQKYNLQGEITLELVESEEIETSKEVKDFFHKARNHGCLIAIDDFGSGYSNFEYLLRIAVDFIKIDGTLIKNIDKDSASRSAVQAIVNFAKSFNVKVVAEYVHNEAVYNEIKSLGIDFAQGFYLHQPSELD